MSDMSQSPKEASRDWAMGGQAFLTRVDSCVDAHKSLPSTFCALSGARTCHLILFSSTGLGPGSGLPSLALTAILLCQVPASCRPRAVGSRWEEGSWATPGAAWLVLLQGVDPGRHVTRSRLFPEVSTHCGRVRGVCFFRQHRSQASLIWVVQRHPDTVEEWVRVIQSVTRVREQTHVCLCSAPC